MDRLLTIMTAFSVALIGMMLVSVRRAHIRVEYSVSWLGAAVVLLVLSFSHAVLDKLAAFFGISYPPVALLLIVMMVFLFVFYRFSIIISDLKETNIALAQRLAIVEFQLHSARERGDEEEA